MLEAIKYKRGRLEIIDQLLLPSKTQYEIIDGVKAGWVAINSMKVRGAPAISIVAALSLAEELEKKEFKTKNDLHQYLCENLKFLSTSRPTAVNLSKVVDLFIELSKQFLQDENLNKDTMKENIIKEMEKLLLSDILINKAIGSFGGKYITEYVKDTSVSILTHCNTGSLATAGYGTALGVIRWLFENNHLKHVYCTETRPYNQGARLTAYELVHDGIPATLICDSMVAALMQSGKVSAVVVGADRVVLNGDTANKIGTYQLAVCAKYHNVPFFIACPRSTLDFSLSSGESIPIEERPSNEMLMINSIPIAAQGIKCWNPAFDVTPAELITGIITEIGVFQPEELKNNVIKLSDMNLLN
ncbi:methylthioribose-1-phosphate isomerase isoform X1 [Parasteatoda tepidariorum]|uniref:methylthioribose-1-phosphate isomerase isoform X1 n=1 Tax=Parasteatoda tepidariorum TaxID=114398 RepID=UPI001C72166C|nr:methylthioribose-1-phosphate isomerase [Parasteatoda tepidariorum]